MEIKYLTVTLGSKWAIDSAKMAIISGEQLGSVPPGLTRPLNDNFCSWKESVAVCSYNSSEWFRYCPRLLRWG